MEMKKQMRYEKAVLIINYSKRLIFKYSNIIIKAVHMCLTFLTNYQFLIYTHYDPCC